MLPDRLTPMIGGTDRQPPASDLSRRNFLQVGVAAGGGLLLSVSLPALTGDADAAGATSFAPNAFIRIEGDGQVVLTMPYIEMGQGTYTSIPMLIAEELEVDLSQVQLEHAPPNERLYGNPLIGGVQATGNSNAIRAAWRPLRRAGATARTMLVSAAAKRWNVNAASCRAQSGEVLHAPKGRRIKYGELAAAAPACLSPQAWCSSGRRISSSSAPRPSGWTHRPRSTERLSMASTFGRRA
jgi:isoquinoline 1-oxidoreductase beta subunit